MESPDERTVGAGRQIRAGGRTSRRLALTALTSYAISVTVKTMWVGLQNCESPEPYLSAVQVRRWGGEYTPWGRRGRSSAVAEVAALEEAEEEEEG